MEALVLSQYANRAGCVLSVKAICDGCFHIFKNGEMAMRCSGFVSSNSNQRNVRQGNLTATVWGTLDHSPYPIRLRIQVTIFVSLVQKIAICIRIIILHWHFVEVNQERSRKPFQITFQSPPYLA
jgi:hypothetical protein